VRPFPETSVSITEEANHERCDEGREGRSDGGGAPGSGSGGLLPAKGAGEVLRTLGEDRVLRHEHQGFAEMRLPLDQGGSPGGHGGGLETEAAWRGFHGRVQSFVARRVRQPADAEDIVQDVFLRMYVAASRLRNSDSVGPWLYRAARNAIVDHYPGRRLGDENGRSATPERSTPDKFRLPVPATKERMEADARSDASDHSWSSLPGLTDARSRSSNWKASNSTGPRLARASPSQV
jgi:RNA polymerase sigma factor (sigma-70 family)